ncbi:hypothetical protein [Aquimarina agarivorans]|uniref:hypothetical protein n=1 Tax=Aquimarina agarivorans TaxID=980584 RepID=UPI000248EA05|nr:hypothetical protein [Aquimarina agarivorans]
MSANTYRNNVSRLQGQIADLKKKEASERKKDVDLVSKINNLSKRISTTKSSTTIQSLQRQIESKLKEQVRFQSKIADIQKQIANKQKELDRNQTNLTRAIEKETKKNKLTS